MNSWRRAAAGTTRASPAATATIHSYLCTDVNRYIFKFHAARCCGDNAGLYCAPNLSTDKFIHKSVHSVHKPLVARRRTFMGSAPAGNYTQCYGSIEFESVDCGRVRGHSVLDKVFCGCSYIYDNLRIYPHGRVRAATGSSERSACEAAGRGRAHLSPLSGHAHTRARARARA